MTRKSFLEFEKFLKSEITPEQAGKLLLEYVSETNHQGWEFSSRDQCGIARFFDDVMLYQRNLVGPEQAAKVTEKYGLKSVEQSRAELKAYDEKDKAIRRWLNALHPPLAVEGALIAKLRKMTPEQIDADRERLLSIPQKTLQTLWSAQS